LPLTPGTRLGAYEVHTQMLFATSIYGGGADIQLGRQYDVTHDGRFLISTLLNEAAVPITLLQNWNPAAKR
jgi:hypothetical protein